MGKLLQTFLKHTGYGTLQVFHEEIGHGTLEFAGSSIVLEHEKCISSCLLLILLDGNQRLVIIGHRNHLALGSIGRSRSNVGKHILDFLLYLIRVYITDNNKPLQVGAVPPAIV